MSAKKTEPAVYNPDEVEAMKKAGYVTARAAASEARMRVDHVYRAIKAQTGASDTTPRRKLPRIRIKIGANGYTRYVHRQDWLEYVKTKRAAVMANLGLDR